MYLLLSLAAQQQSQMQSMKIIRWIDYTGLFNKFHRLNDEVRVVPNERFRNRQKRTTDNGAVVLYFTNSKLKNSFNIFLCFISGLFTVGANFNVDKSINLPSVKEK